MTVENSPPEEDNSLDKNVDPMRRYPSPHDEFAIPGDPSYAPPEQYYGYVDPDWNRRRLGCDAYLLGSLVVFFFTRTAMTALLISRLDPSFLRENWGGTFDEVLPYVRYSFGEAVDAFSIEVPSDIREDLTTAVRQLCDPDPRLRGHPLDKIGHHNQYSLQRYISKFDLLAKRAEYGLIGGR